MKETEMAWIETGLPPDQEIAIYRSVGIAITTEQLRELRIRLLRAKYAHGHFLRPISPRPGTEKTYMNDHREFDADE